LLFLSSLSSDVSEILLIVLALEGTSLVKGEILLSIISSEGEESSLSSYSIKLV